MFVKMTAKERASLTIFITTFVVYTVISMTKSAYATSIAALVQEGVFAKSSAGIINAGFYVTYGGALLLGVKIVDKISPIKLILFTLLGSLILLLGMMVADNFWAMFLLWSACGLVQSPIWPATIRVLSEYLLPEHKERAMVFISFSYCVGMMLSYLMAAIVLSVAGWQMLFLASAICVALCVVAWVIVTQKEKKELHGIIAENQVVLEKVTKLQEQSLKAKKETTVMWKTMLSSGLILLLIPALLRSALDGGVKAWMPTMLMDSYGISAGFANGFITVLLVVNLAGIFIANGLHPHCKRNAAYTLSACFILSFPFTLMLLWLGKIPLVLLMGGLVVITTMMYAGHQVANVMIPTVFSKYHMAGSVSSVLNGAASFGLVLSNFGFGFIAEHLGWHATIVSWVLMCFVATAFCILAGKSWKKHFRK